MDKEESQRKKKRTSKIKGKPRMRFLSCIDYALNKCKQKERIWQKAFSFLFHIWLISTLKNVNRKGNWVSQTSSLFCDHVSSVMFCFNPCFSFDYSYWNKRLKCWNVLRNNNTFIWFILFWKFNAENESFIFDFYFHKFYCYRCSISIVLIKMYWIHT